MPYYVGEHFSKEVNGVNLKNLERTVEDDYISNLRNNCWKEKQQSMLARETNRACLSIHLAVVSAIIYQFWENAYDDYDLISLIYLS